MSFTESLDELIVANHGGLLRKAEHWERVPLGHIADVQNGFPFPSDRFTQDSGIPLLRIRDVRRDSTEACFEGEVDPSYLVQAGDLVVGMDGDFHCALWRGPTAALNQRVCRITPDEAYFSRRFLVHVLPAYLNAINGATSSVTVKHLSSRTVAEIPLPLPPIAEQRRIVAAIEEHLSRLDAAVAGLKRVQAMIPRYRAAVLKAACEGMGLTVGPPPHEQLASLLAEDLANGRSVPTASNGFPVLRLTAIQNGRVVLSERKSGAWTRRDAERFLVRLGDFFVIRGNGSVALVGRGGLVTDTPDPVAFPDTLIRLRPATGRLNPEYLRLVWDSDPVRRQLEQRAKTSAGIHKVNQQDLLTVSLPLPTIEQQARIVTESEEQLSNVEAVRREIDGAVARADRLRQSILKRAFEGKLVPQDPNDEPASVLLERIRAVRVTAGAAKRPRAGKSPRQR